MRKLLLGHILLISMFASHAYAQCGSLIECAQQAIEKAEAAAIAARSNEKRLDNLEKELIAHQYEHFNHVGSEGIKIPGSESAIFCAMTVVHFNFGGADKNAYCAIDKLANHWRIRTAGNGNHNCQATCLYRSGTEPRATSGN